MNTKEHLEILAKLGIETPAIESVVEKAVNKL